MTWVRVSDCLPPLHEPVLALYPQIESTSIRPMCRAENCWYDMGDEPSSYVAPLYWMPLPPYPDPPDEEKQRVFDAIRRQMAIDQAEREAEAYKQQRIKDLTA